MSEEKLKKPIEETFETYDQVLFGKLNSVENDDAFMTYKFMIPFNLPIPNNKTFILGDKLYHYKEVKYDHYARDDSYEMSELLHSYIEVTKILKSKEKKQMVDKFNTLRNGKQRQILTKIFDEYLHELNMLIKAIQIKYQQLNLHKIELKDIIGIPIYIVYSMKDEKFTKHRDGSLHVQGNSRIDVQKYEILLDEDIDFIFKNYKEINETPFAHMAYIARMGERSYDLQDYNSTIVHYNTVFETYITDFVINYYKLNTEKTESYVHNLRNKTGLSNLIDDHFLKKIHDLKFNHCNTIEKIIAIYMRTSYIQRNKVVHEGMSYGKNEAFKILDLILDLTTLIAYEMMDAEENDFISMYRKYSVIQTGPSLESILKKYK